jgi:hypothetical protein
MITPMSSHPGVTERGLPNVFRLTNVVEGERFKEIGEITSDDVPK